MFIQYEQFGDRGKAHLGEFFYTADNPPFGAVFTYYMKEKLKTKKELRQDAEKEAAKKNQTLPYPTHEDMRAEAEEEAPTLFFVVSDSSGKPVRRINANNAPGIQRSSWDLRYPAATLPSGRSEDDDDDFFGAPAGPLVMPGRYSVQLFKRTGGVTTALGQPQSFNVAQLGAENMNPQDRAELSAFQEKVARLWRAVSGAQHTADDLRTQLHAIRRALNETPGADRQLTDQLDKLDQNLNLLMRNLRGDSAVAAHSEATPPSTAGRVQNIMFGERLSLAKPTGTHLEEYRIASEEFTQELATLHQLVDVDLKNLEKGLETAGAPWTPGRVPDWQEQ